MTFLQLLCSLVIIIRIVICLFSGYEELSLAVRTLQNNEALRGDKRLFFFGPAADSSHGNHSVADGIIDEWYGKKCVICGADGATRAHIVSGRVTTDFESFGPPTYSDALDVKSHRNFIPLCGTLGEKGSCHDAFDRFLITILYNEIAGKYVCYCIAPVKEFTRRDQVHLKELNMHSDHQPYKRLLAWRTRKGFIEHSYWVSGEDVGNLVGIVDLSETASTRPVQGSDSVSIDDGS